MEAMLDHPQMRDFWRAQAEYDRRNNLPRVQRTQETLQKLKVLFDVFVSTAVFLPLQTPDSIVECLDQQNTVDDDITTYEAEWTTPVACEAAAELPQNTLRKCPCTTKCQLIDGMIELAASKTDWDVHPIFDPILFFESVNNMDTKADIMPALLLASCFIKTPEAYEFIDGIINGKRVTENLLTDASYVQPASNPEAKQGTTTRFFLNFDCNRGKPISQNQKRKIDKTLKQIAKKLTYKFCSHSEMEKIRGGEKELVHGVCKSIFRGGQTHSSEISLDEQMLTPLVPHGGIGTLRQCFKLAVVLVHEVTHAITAEMDPESFDRGEMLFQNEVLYSSEGELGCALERHLFGITHAFENMSDEEVCAKFWGLLSSECGT